MLKNKEETSKKGMSRAVKIIGWVSIVLGAILWLYIIAHFDSTDYVFRPLALLPLFSMVLNLGLIAFLYRRIQSSETGIWFLVFLATLAMWSFSEVMQRSSGNVELAIDWRLLAGFSWAAMPVVYLYFALSYVDRQEDTRRLHFLAGIFLVLTAIIYGQFSTNLVLSDQYALEAWGYDSPNGPFLSMFGIWLAALLFFAIYLLVQEHKNTLSIRKRKQIKIFVIGILIPVVGGLVTDIVLPAFGMHILPMAAFLTSMQGIIVGYGITKHGLFKINPVSLSGEIMKTLPQPVIATNKELDIQFMNANAELMFREHAPFLGKNIYNLVGTENLKTIKESLEKSLSIEDIVNIPRMPLGLKEGVVIAQAQISSMQDGGGYIFGLSNITQQILTMRIIEKEVKIRTELYNQERARLLSSVNGLRQGFLIADNDQKIVLMNVRAQEMFPEIKMSAVQDGNVIDSNAISVLKKYLSGFNLDEKLKTVIDSNQYIEIDGVEMNKLVFDIDILPIVMSNKAVGAVILFDDVTERTVLERSKEEFFSIASHELRTPLTAIRGNTSMILNYYGDKLNDPELKGMLDDIYASSLRLIEIVNDFLDMSRLEQGKMVFNMADIPVNQVIEEVIKETTNMAKESANEIIFNSREQSSPIVNADRDKLKQVIYNLVGNALKFTKNGTITLSSEVEQSTVKVRVSDTGRGIPDDTMKLLFRKFQQAGDSLITRDATKGTGLGLYISKLILDKMDGNIGIENTKQGVGSTFYFTIPVARVGREEHNTHTRVAKY
ncbi:hypothetical protein A3F37_04500 [Candidatus Saccharibacteria bacterium RIFCSPHIGHO2_12_FULL_41_12]|nr:MAG: hypothetical protein A3F37_04500 [Candidatus Saccharibacteria bacterium RIFCSPHIGHO2_12_FULL_41_12]